MARIRDSLNGWLRVNSAGPGQEGRISTVDEWNAWVSFRPAEAGPAGRARPGDHAETPGWIMVDDADWLDLEAAVVPAATVPRPPAPATGGGGALGQHALPTDYSSRADTLSLQPVKDIQNFTAWVDAWQRGAPGERAATTQPEVHAMWLRAASQFNTAATPMLWATAHINNLAQQVAALSQVEVPDARTPPTQQTLHVTVGPGKAIPTPSTTAS